MLQVKIKSRLKFLNLHVGCFSICFFLALIIHELGPGDKRHWESTQVQKFLTWI